MNWERVYQHTQDRNIGLMTAVPGERHSLEHDIRSNGLGVIHVEGRYPPTDPTTDHSYLVIGQRGDDSGHLKGFLLKHAKKYNQPRVLYKPHHTENAYWLPSNTEHQKTDVGPFHPRKMGEYHAHLMHSTRPLTAEYVFLVRVSPLQFGRGREAEFI